MRILYFDIIRAVAIILIVFTHAWAQLTTNLDFVTTQNSWILTRHGWIIWQIFHLLNRDGVPLFAMLTGALMLGRSYPDISAFLKKKLPKFIMATLIAAALYGFLVHFLFGTSLKGNLHNIMTGAPAGAYHLWYMYMLIGLYISIPFLARMLTALSQWELVLLILLSFALVTVPTTLSADSFRFSYFSAYSFIIQTYALYALLGYWLHKYNGLYGISLLARCLLFLTLMAATICIKYYLLYPATPPAQLDTISTYDSLYVYAGSVLLFSIIRDYSVRFHHLNKGIALLAVASWSIYLWHLIAIHIMNYIYPNSGFNPFVTVIAGFCAAMAIGFIPYFLLRKTKLAWLVQ